MVAGALIGTGAGATTGRPVPGRIAMTAMHLDPAPAGLHAVAVWSPSLRRSVRVLIALPASYTPKRRYPVLYLLHGTPDTPDGLARGLGIPDRVNRAAAHGTLPPAIVVIPTGAPKPEVDTEWEDSALQPSERWASFVARDLVAWIDHHYATRADRAHRAIAGISMGGHGAVNIALHHPERFAIAASWSGYFDANTPSVEGPAGSPA